MIEKWDKKMRIIAIINSIFFLLVFNGVSYAETPLGYPWSTWGELSHTSDAREEKGLKLDAYRDILCIL
jgi:hypothetical protein